MAFIRRDSLVRHTDHLAIEHRLGQPGVWCKVKVGEEDLSRPHPLILRTDRLLDLDHHIGLLPELVGRIDDLATRRLVLSITDATPVAGSAFNQHCVAEITESPDSCRGQSDPRFIVLDLFW